MFKELTPPAWLPELNRWVQRLGPRYALLLFCALVLLMALALSQLLVSLLGYGDRTVAAICAGMAALGVGSLLGAMFLSLHAQLEQSLQQLKRCSDMDALTGVVNRRAFLNLIEREWALARRYETTCALVLLDVDHFKSVNDSFGHRCGDMLLRQIAEASSETLRQGDVLSRFGGGEFMLFLPHTDPLGALDVAERIRERVEGLDFCWNGQCIPVSVSLGVAALQADHGELDQFVNAAELALQAAKESGRNCVRAGDAASSNRPSRPGRPAELKR
ncbi:GGDEF domain-containing protein [Roseateles oligotrophus]|uniref:diguanylate cyclase n=1 Tax=Roseateles oligotrophus TaxID=1769250 RepID=A0ABT2YFV7_9BURK|nr:GGDEF domain-containing protein [Roseateles oligotrophus]MCV2368933.1 GGDEF domain-containing protein [Roseateles oligotrophus]